MPFKKLELKFLEAAEKRNLKIVEQCIELGVNPNCHLQDRVTALHLAAERGDIELASLLLSIKGLNLNAFTSHGNTPLIIACNSRQENFVEFLLENGADVNLTERFGKTPLHYITASDCVSTARILISYGAVLDVLDTFCHTPLSIAVVDRSYLPMVKLLIENGADVDFDRTDLTLHLFLEACLGCHTEKELEVIIYLLENGADANVTCPLTNRNALHLVAITGYLPLARELEKLDTRANKKDFSNKTPYDIAVEHGHDEMAEFLDVLMVLQKKFRNCDDDDDVSMAQSIISINKYK